ncbi:MAG: hypothetical protein ABSG64_08615 [Solirubrobacteraceae bacterium]|jgi:hypothetical protein
MRSRTATCAIGLLLAATALSACGSSSSGNGIASKSPNAIVAATVAALKSLTSVHVDGSVTNAAGTTTSLNFSVASNGASGSIAQGPDRFQMVEVAGTIYVKATAAVWSSYSPTAAQLLGGKWLKMPPGNTQFASLTGLTNIHALFANVRVQPGITLTKGATTTVDGVKVVALNNVTKGATVYIATTGKPYVIEISEAASAAAGLSVRLVFSDFNTPVPLAAPPHALNFSALAKLAG